jgi:protein involved in polysaccharide export with SLBB domain
MVIGTSTIVFAAAAAVGVVFAFAPPADARFMHQCSGKYQAAAKAGCGVNAAKARPPRPRGITLGIGDVVSITIFEPPGGLFVPSERPGNFVTLPNQIVDSNGNIIVPYASTIPAAGRTPSEVQQAINEALRALPRIGAGNRCPSPCAPTGLASPVHADRQDWTVFEDGRPIDRVRFV